MRAIGYRIVSATTEFADVCACKKTGDSGLMNFAKISLLMAGIATAFTLFACQTHRLTPSEGYVNVTGGRVWYRIVGSGSRTPLLVVNGGPGNSSHYVKPLSALADERPVIFYDQLGCGRSDRPDDTTLWRTERFVEEVAQIRKALGLEEVHLYGHSWGTMLAVDYMLTKPKGIKSLILASPALSIRDGFRMRITCWLPYRIRSRKLSGRAKGKRRQTLLSTRVP